MNSDTTGQEPTQQETAEHRLHEYFDPKDGETKTVKVFQEYCPIQKRMVWPMVRVTNGEVTISPHAKYI